MKGWHLVVIGLWVCAIMLLAGCGTTRYVEVDRPVSVPVKTRVACPDKATYDKLKSERPVPLRQQKAPATAVERVAKTEAQLGLYEAEGGWGDKAQAALDRCQVADPEPGVAVKP